MALCFFSGSLALLIYSARNHYFSTPQESLCVFADLQARKLRLTDFVFIGQHIEQIVCCLCSGFGYVGATLVNSAWLNAQSGFDRRFIEDYIAWRYAVINY